MRISVYDLVKATAASVVLLARPKIDPDGNNADIPLLSINSTAILTAKEPPTTSVARSSKRKDVNGQTLRRPVPGDVSSPVWESGRGGTVNASSGRNGALLDGRTKMTVAVDTAGREKAEDRLRVVAAAMQTVAAALSLVVVSLSKAFINDDGVGQGRDCDQALSSTETPGGRWDAAAADAAVSDASLEQIVSNNDAHQQRYSEDLDAGMAETRLNFDCMPGNFEEGPGEQARSGTDSGRAANEVGEAKMVLESAALTSEETGRGKSGVGVGVGDALWRVAGTPTLDAVSGDVHLVALVAGKRSLTRLLHFVDLVSF